MDDPEVVDAMNNVLEKAAQSPVAAGVAMGYNPATIAVWLEKGLQWINFNGDWQNPNSSSTACVRRSRRVSLGVRDAARTSVGVCVLFVRAVVDGGRAVCLYAFACTLWPAHLGLYAFVLSENINGIRRVAPLWEWPLWKGSAAGFHFRHNRSR
jgi:hypothetical protein